MRSILASLILLCSFNSIAEDSFRSFEWTLEAAQQGHSIAQNNLGWMYETGNEVEKNFVKAFFWYEKSANQGSAIAQNNLGLMYEFGRGTPRDYKKAFEWYIKSANQGNELAKKNLDYMYDNNRGLSGVPKEAFKWYEKFAKQGNPEAQAYLGYLHQIGKGTAKDYKKAFEWYRRAANNGDMLAQTSLGYFYEFGKGTGLNLQKAFEWYLKAANSGDDLAQYSLGLLHEIGKGTPRDYKKAFEWYIKSANQGNELAKENLDLLLYKFDMSKGLDEWFKWLEMFAKYGNADAQNSLAVLYFRGEGITQDYSKAFEWYKKSAEQGNQYAQSNLGQLYEFGKGVSQDLNKAFEWYQKSAKQGYAKAQLDLGMMYDSGKVTTKDSKKAFEWYEKAANQGLSMAQNNLGVLYEKGDGVLQDYKKAFEWYEKAANQGLSMAQNNLGVLYEKGDGVLQDYKKAIYWYEKSAKSGFTLSLMNLSSLYGEGLGVEKDEIKAKELYDTYSQQTYLEAQTNLTDCKTPSCIKFSEKEELTDEDNKKEYDYIQMSEIQANSFTQVKKSFESIELLESLAIKGDTSAQKKLGVIYWWSKKEGDKKLSLYWTKKAAQQGDSEAQNNYGTFFYNGEFINKNLDKAFDWYQLSAEQGNALAMRNLGSFYLLINQDINNAIKYFTMAYYRGEISAAWSLGYLYMNDLNGNEFDENLAYEWMFKGAQAGYKPAQFKVSKMLLNGTGVKPNKKTSFNWLLKASRKQGNQFDQWTALIRRDLAYRYFYGIGVEASLVEAQKIDPNYIMELITDGAISSQQLHQMAQGYEFELKDLEKARFWYEKAAEKGSMHAQRRAGLLYSTFAHSAGLLPDYDKAEFWFLKAIEQGDLESMTRLAELYYDENERPGVRNTLYNPSKAFDFLIRAKESGAKNYHMGLTYLYRHGIGTERDVQKAMLIIEDKLESIEDWEKWYWMWDLWSIHVENNLSDDEAISRVMTYFIDQAKLGDVGAINTLAEMYLEKNFEYFDEKEAMYWLNEAKDSSFSANILLSEYTDNFSEYGEYILKAIDLHETGNAEDFVSEDKLIETYFSAAAYFRDVNAPEKVESLLRKVSLIIPQIEDNSFRIFLNIFLAGISQDQETSESYLNDKIIINNQIIADNLNELQLKFYALINLHEMYLDEGEVEAALDIAINALKVIDLFGSSNDYLFTRITLLQYIAKDYIQLKDFENASSYFELLSKHINIRLSDEYKREYSRNTTINDDVTEIWRDIIGAIIKVHNGSIDEGFTELNVALDKVNEGEIPLRRHDLDFALIPLEYFTQNGDYDKATVLMSKVIDLYREGVEKRIKYNSTVPAEEKDKIRDAISEYIYISSKGNNDLKDRGFEVMQLASGLTLSDTVIKSISIKELSGTLYIKSKLLETLNDDRRNLIDEKFKNLSSGVEKLQALDKRLNDLDQQINSLEKDLKSSLGDTLDEFITSSEMVKENLSENDALITMLISSQRSYVWLTTKEGVFRHDSEMTSREVSEHAQILIKSLDPAQMGKTAFPVDSSSKLYELLIAPFKDKLDGIDRLIFSPDPILSQIPFSILTRSSGDSFDVVSGSDELRGAAVVKLSPTQESVTNDLAKVDWLIKDYSIAIIPSVYSYVGLESYNSNEIVDSFLGIGNPVLSGSDVVLRGVEKVALKDQRGSISRTISDLSALPETEIELNTIAKFFTNSEVITQNDATETKIRDMDLSGFDVVAFATHALVSNEIDDLFEPAIVLTPVDSDNSENDGLLMASEIAELNMDADIVLLSACNTASAFGESNSQGLSGIADSFFEAGAKSLLVSYWSVISDSAVDITTRMFDKSNTGKSYAHRHRESILQLLKESNNYQTNPVYWAPFMVVGVN